MEPVPVNDLTHQHLPHHLVMGSSAFENTEGN